MTVFDRVTPQRWVRIGEDRGGPLEPEHIRAQHVPEVDGLPGRDGEAERRHVEVHRLGRQDLDDDRQFVLVRVVQ